MHLLQLISFSSLRLLFSALGFLALVGGAGAADDSTSRCEPTPVSDRTKVLSVIKEIASYSAGANADQRGMSLPTGNYTLEAQDDDYWYFRAPSPIGVRQRDYAGKMAERRAAGGVRISKARAGGPACAYIDEGGRAKELIYEINATEFAWMEGAYWKKNF